MTATATTDRYAAQVLRVHRELSFTGLLDAIDGPPAYLEHGPHELVTVTVRGDQLPERYLWGLFGFRLAQYLQRGWVDRELLQARAITAEPFTAAARRDYHTVVLERRTGQIRGYGTLAATKDAPGTTLAAGDRRPFVVEVDYGIDLADHLGAEVGSDRVWEGKRLIRDYAMPRSPAAAAVPWWVYLGWASTITRLFGAGGAHAVVGDGRKGGALFQLGLLGFDLRTLEVAARAPHPDDLFAPLWDQTEPAWPFILRDSPRLAPTLRALHEVLCDVRPGSVRRRLEARIRDAAG